MGIFYKSNKASWLTKSIFQEYLEFINNMLIQNERKILLLVDNAPGHKISSFSNIKIIELPPNTTAFLQPLDQGIIKSFKNHYKNKLNNFITSKLLCDDLNFKDATHSLTLLDVIFWIKDSIDKISNNTVKNCWAVFTRMKENYENKEVNEKNTEQMNSNEIEFDNLLVGNNVKIIENEVESIDNVFNNSSSLYDYEGSMYHICALEKNILK